MTRRSPSLLLRAFAAIALLMLLSVLTWQAVYLHFEREPRARQLAQWVVTSINTVRPALLNTTAETRLDLLFDLALAEDIRIYPADGSDPIKPLPQNPLIEALTDNIRLALGPKTRFAGAVDDTPGFWVSFFIAENDEYWLRLPMEHIVRQSERAWLGWAALSLCLALAAAWLLVAYLTRPLGRLALAAREVARGERKTHLDERGPDEIAQVAAAFNHMAQALQTMEDDRAMSLAGISHDLRTPLTRLRLEIEMSALPEETREAMALEIGEMDTLIGQFIDFARGVDDEAWEELDLPQLVENVAQTFSRRGAKVAISHTPKRLAKPIIGKPLGLYRAISNLVTNALLYAGREKPIEIAVEDAGEHVIIHVLDRGPGLSALAAESVKRPFIRGQAARSDTGGAGLGLAIVERIARWHGGGLSLEPRDGGGLDAQLKLAKALPDIPR